MGLCRLQSEVEWHGMRTHISCLSCFFREYGIGNDNYDDAEEVIWQVAAEKVERRTPYVKEWGDGISVANTVEETEKIWQQVKKQEKEKKLEQAVVGAVASDSSNNISTNGKSSPSSSAPVSPCKYRTSNGTKRKLSSSFSLVGRRFKEHGTLIGTATMAFTLGMFVSRLMIKRGL